MEIVIETVNLNKIFNSKSAVKDVNLNIRKSSIFGFVGPNGAGKTTTVNMLVGMFRPTSGNIKIFDIDSVKHSIDIKRRIGVVTEDSSLFEQLKAEEQLYLTAKIYRLDRKTIKNRTDELFDFFDLNNHRYRFIYEYSKGMKKKLVLMCALIHDPEILFLDEPFEGLDPVSTRIIRENLSLMADNGKTVFITSHNLLLIENLCTDIAIINNGEILIQSSIENIRKNIKDKTDNYSGLESLFHELIEPEESVRYLSWIKE